MNRTNKILVVVLVAQMVLLMARAFWPESESRASGSALLADLSPEAVTQLRITDSSGRQVLLQKDNDSWVLPDYGNYPVTGTRVSSLLGKITALRTDRLITRSSTSHRRLKVSGDEFERLIHIQAGAAAHDLYLGKSGGGNTLHVRLDDQAQVYLVSGLSTSDASALVTPWIDTLYFSAAADQVTGLRLQNAQGDFEFTKTGDTWTMAGLGAEEALNQQNLKAMLNQITALRMTAPIGTQAQDTFGMDAPQATITLRLLEPVESPASTPDTSIPMLLTATPDPLATPEPTATPHYVENEYTILIGAAQENGVVVKSSRSDYYVLVSTDTANRFIQKTRQDFIAPPATPTPSPTSAPAEMTATALPMSVPEAPSTPQPTFTPEPAGAAGSGPAN